MRSRRSPWALAALCAASFTTACADDAADTSEGAEPEAAEPTYVKGGATGKEDASALATVLDFEFKGELLTDSAWDTRRVIQDQLLFTIGHLNANKSVGRLDRLELTDIQTAQSGGKTRITYSAKMPVAWGSKVNLPTEYVFTLPLDVSYSGQEAFATKYKARCVDHGAHDVDAGSMWYYYRPATSGCALEAADVVKVTAKVAVSDVNTTGKYPEYHKVWEDDALKVVSVFGKYEDGATASSDAGISAYNTFVAAVKRRFAQAGLQTTPAMVPTNPGVASPDIEFRATLPDGRTVQVNALLVDNVASASQTFYDRYEGLSAQADLIAYNGHAGLGQNVRALARKGQWEAGQYVIVFMNGCDTFAYVDGSLAQTRAAINPDDPTGSKYLDFVVNAMPAYFAQDSRATMTLVDGLLDYAAPKSYEVMFKNIDSSQVVLVTGEADNVYFPGYEEGGATDVTPTDAWAGLSEAGTVARGAEKRFETPVLPAGDYTFETTGTGDADLYVRVGMAPTNALYDCRPYRTSTTETCTVTLTTPAPVHVMVQGYAATSNYELTGAAK
jgi:hypothetical protein